jgi:ADP-ribosylglycohydrolase
MFVELAIADAYGCQLEYIDESKVVEYNDLTFNCPLPGHIPKGCYTDDTQMTIALAESLLYGNPWTVEGLAEKFVRVFQRNKRKGYTPPFFMILMNCENGQDLLNKIHGNSDKSGSAMRSSPLGLIEDLNELKEKSRIQAMVTHNCVEGITSAECAALLVHFFYHSVDKNKDVLVEWLARNLSEEGKEYLHPYQTTSPVSTNGWDCVNAAIMAIYETDTLGDLLKKCVDLRGDTDTVATIAMAAASCSDLFVNDLPKDLYDGLENGTYGKGYLQHLEQRLMNKYPRRIAI